MTESQVQEQIKTREVLKAFERAKLSSMPRGVKKDYDDEDSQYDKYSQHTAAEVSKGEEKGLKRGLKRGLLTAAHGMKKLKFSTDQIVEATGLSPVEVDEINYGKSIEEAPCRWRCKSMIVYIALVNEPHHHAIKSFTTVFMPVQGLC